MPKLKIKGNIKTSSTSKTKKTRQIRKNRIENGRRALNLVEKPHSNGLSFSRSKNIFLFNLRPAKKIKQVNTKITTKTILREKIYLKYF